MEDNPRLVRHIRHKTSTNLLIHSRERITVMLSYSREVVLSYIVKKTGPMLAYDLKNTTLIMSVHDSIMVFKAKAF